MKLCKKEENGKRKEEDRNCSAQLDAQESLGESVLLGDFARQAGRYNADGWVGSERKISLDNLFACGLGIGDVDSWTTFNFSDETWGGNEELFVGANIGSCKCAVVCAGSGYALD